MTPDKQIEQTIDKIYVDLVRLAKILKDDGTKTFALSVRFADIIFKINENL